MKRGIFLSLLVIPCLLSAQGWKEDFSKIKPKTYSVSQNAVMQNDGNSITIRRTGKGMASFSRYVPYDFAAGIRYLQMRFVSATGVFNVSSDFGNLQTWLRPKEGLFTWRTVSLHKNMADAKADKNGTNCDANWKIALKPNGRKLDIFAFEEGPFVGENVKKAIARVMLVPQDDKGLRKLAKAESFVEIRTVASKVLRRMKVGKIIPYGTKDFVVDLANINVKEADLVLVTDGQDFAQMRFYRIPFWRP